MEYFTSYCWVRDKSIGPQKPPPPSKEKRHLEIFFCSGCFDFVKYENRLVKRAQIGDSLFGFCSEECYLEWLNSPGTMFLGKLN